MKTRTLLPPGAKCAGRAARLPAKVARRSADSRAPGTFPAAPLGHMAQPRRQQQQQGDAGPGRARSCAWMEAADPPQRRRPCCGSPPAPARLPPPPRREGAVAGQPISSAAQWRQRLGSASGAQQRAAGASGTLLLLLPPLPGPLLRRPSTLAPLPLPGPAAATCGKEAEQQRLLAWLFPRKRNCRGDLTAGGGAAAAAFLSARCRTTARARGCRRQQGAPCF